eukprot:9466552-Pyramimonas_sp.AAC.1
MDIRWALDHARIQGHAKFAFWWRPPQRRLLERGTERVERFHGHVRPAAVCAHKHCITMPLFHLIFERAPHVRGF